MIIDPIGDLLTRIRNGQMRRSSKVRSPNSRLRIRLLDVLQEEGYIRSVDELKPHRQGLGISILSTPQGVMTDQSAREKHVGGEILCQVF
jgi:small subunit ribosomal protein S8